MEVVKIRKSLVLAKDTLQGLIDNAEDIESTAVVIKWKDGTVTAGWSQMEISTLFFMAAVLQQKAIQDATIYE